MDMDPKLLEWIGPRPDGEVRKILHVGCGVQNLDGHPIFGGMSCWKEIRYDGDALCAPDIVGDLTSMDMIESNSIDCIYGNHCIEHLVPEDALRSLCEMSRVIHERGYILLTCPDLAFLADHLSRDEGLKPVYTIEASELKGGLPYKKKRIPVMPLDMVHGASFMSQQMPLMRHSMAFDIEKLKNFCYISGFTTAKGWKNGSNLVVMGFHQAMSDDLIDSLMLALMQFFYKKDVPEREDACR